MARKRRSKQYKRSSRVIDMDKARQQRLEKREKAQIDIPREQTTSDERKMRRMRALRKKQSRRKLIVCGAAIILIAFMCLSVFDILKLKAEEREALKKQEQLKAKQEQLQEDLKEADSEQNIEDQARERLKLTKKGETIYIPDAEEADAGNPDAGEAGEPETETSESSAESGSEDQQ